MKNINSWNDLWSRLFFGWMCVFVSNARNQSTIMPSSHQNTMTYSKRNSFTTFCLCLGWEWRNQGASVWIHAQWVSGRHPGRAGRAQVRPGRTLELSPSVVCVLCSRSRDSQLPLYFDVTIVWPAAEAASGLHQVEKLSSLRPASNGLTFYLLSLWSQIHSSRWISPVLPFSNNITVIHSGI